MIQGQNFFSKKITLAAGEESEVFPGQFSTVMILAGTATDYNTDIGLRIGNMGFRTLPTGTSFTPSGNEPITTIQFKNTGSVSRTFHALAALGDLRSYNLQINGDVAIDTVTIDDTTPLKVNIADQDLDPINVALTSAINALISSLDTAVAAIKTAVESIDSKMDTALTSLDNIDTNTTP